MANIPGAAGQLPGLFGPPGNSDLAIAYNGTTLVISHNHGIEISCDFNWTNAALGLLEKMLVIQKEPRFAIQYDWGFTASGKIQIGRICLNTALLNITAGYDPNHTGQYGMFLALKEQFDKAKKMKAFL
jgi:hypothetical protein